MQHDHALNKSIFELLTSSPGSGREHWESVGKMYASIMLNCDSLSIDMQHDHVLKK